jgi:hypothetical protein
MDHITPASGRTAFAKGAWKKTPIVWFVVGFCVSWAAWSLMAYSRNTSHDQIPPAVKALNPNWVNTSIPWRTGPLTILLPPNTTEASMIVYPTQPPHFPIYYLLDEHSDGRPQELQVDDASGRKFIILNSGGDGQFDRYFYSIGRLANMIV